MTYNTAILLTSEVTG